MAAKKRTSSKNGSSVGSNGFAGYVDVRLDVAAKEAYDEWVRVQDSEVVWSFLEQRVSDDYKFSLKHDNYGGGVQASLMCSLKSSPDCGLVLTARAPDVFNAVMVLIFKATVLMTEDWVVYLDRSGANSQWG